MVCATASATTFGPDFSVDAKRSGVAGNNDREKELSGSRGDGSMGLEPTWLSDTEPSLPPCPPYCVAGGRLVGRETFGVAESVLYQRIESVRLRGIPARRDPVDIVSLPARRRAWVSGGSRGGMSLSHLGGALSLPLHRLHLVVLDVKCKFEFAYAGGIGTRSVLETEDQIFEGLVIRLCRARVAPYAFDLSQPNALESVDDL